MSNTAPGFFVTVKSAINDPANADIKEALQNIHNRFEVMFQELDAKMGKLVVTDKTYGDPLDELEVRFRATKPMHDNPVFQKLSVNLSFIYMALADIQVDLMGDVQHIFNKTLPGKIPAVLPTVTKLWETVQRLRDEATRIKSDDEIQKLVKAGKTHAEDLPLAKELSKLRVFI